MYKVIKTICERFLFPLFLDIYIALGLNGVFLILSVQTHVRALTRGNVECKIYCDMDRKFELSFEAHNSRL